MLRPLVGAMRTRAAHHAPRLPGVACIDHERCQRKGLIKREASDVVKVSNLHRTEASCPTMTPG
ncbi:hypothetical protein FHU36_007501 [Nonomuraea muscovyensis]|uniref:Uncharacterized protein n=1 Tax=Nonomuraea muscovyensis TaxID=1124761 RepID=A0A7X0F2B8_9ACTN|nr:hypothetical protein [Nonomuraea muscovyensis]